MMNSNDSNDSKFETSQTGDEISLQSSSPNWYLLAEGE